jgi:hypothetical protein
MPNLFAGLADTPTETPYSPYFFLCTESDLEPPQEVAMSTVDACVVVFPDKVVISGKSPTLRRLLVLSLAQTVPLSGTNWTSSQARYLIEWANSPALKPLQVARKLSILQAAVVCRMLGEQAMTDKVVVDIENWRRENEQEREAYIDRMAMSLGFKDAFEVGQAGSVPFHVWFFKDRLHVEPDVEQTSVN